MDTNKIIKRFETRKRVTKKALEDLQAIFKWIEKIMDNTNFVVRNQFLGLRGSACNSSGNVYHFNSMGFSYYLGIWSGECGIFEDCDYGYDKVNLYDLDYINLSDIQKALELLFAELENFSTREKTGKIISNIAALLA